MIAIASIISLVAQPLWKVGKFFYIPGRLDKVKRKNVNVTLGILAAVALFIFAMPLPHRVFCTLEIKPRNARLVFVEVPGQLIEVMVHPGDYVKQGTLLAKLSSIDLELTIADLEGKREQYLARLDNRRHAATIDEDAAGDIPQLTKMITMLDEQLVERRADVAKLDLIAPVDGTVLPPPMNPERPSPNHRLKGWSGSPFAKKNLGATLLESTLFCEIGDPHEMEADLIIEQDDLEFVHEDQRVAIKIDELPHRTFYSTITEIAKIDLKVMPKSLTSKAGGEMATKTDEASGTEKPFNTSYQALAPIDDPEGLLANGLKGRAKISTHWQTLGRQARRYLSRTFNFRL
jgi:putative peptide zinc metalloprotease protein